MYSCFFFFMLYTIPFVLVLRNFFLLLAAGAPPLPLLLRLNTSRVSSPNSLYRLIVANTHLYFHPHAAHIRLMQLVALVERWGVSTNFGFPHVVCSTRLCVVDLEGLSSRRSEPFSFNVGAGCLCHLTRKKLVPSKSPIRFRTVVLGHGSLAWVRIIGDFKAAGKQVGDRRPFSLAQLSSLPLPLYPATSHRSGFPPPSPSPLSRCGRSF